MPIIGESETLQYMHVLFRCHGNNQNSFHELPFVNVEGATVFKLHLINQPAFTCSKLTMETPKQCVKSVHI